MLRVLAICSLLAACAIAHELAHVLAARRLGLPHDLQVLPGRLALRFRYRTGAQAVLVALAGIGAELAFAGLFALLHLPWQVPLIMAAGHLCGADGLQIAAALLGRLAVPPLPHWWRLALNAGVTAASLAVLLP